VCTAYAPSAEVVRGAAERAELRRRQAERRDRALRIHPHGAPHRNGFTGRLAARAACVLALAVGVWAAGFKSEHMFAWVVGLPAILMLTRGWLLRVFGGERP
jgi:hypothetical protein